jgi:hypothetical protein
VLSSWPLVGEAPAPAAVLVRLQVHSTPIRRWRHYRLTGLAGPNSLALRKQFDQDTAVFHGPQNQRFPEATAILADLGLQAPEPPQHC